MIKVAYVILHYETNEDTINCIDSILRINTEEVINYIIVIDNASPNERFYELEKKYKKQKVIFIQNDKNLGFAKGNNVGFMYAKKRLDPDFIVLCNNDVIIDDKLFSKKIECHYNNNNFHVAGPSIISLVDGKNQNPVAKYFNSKKEIKNRILRLEILYFLCYIDLDVIVSKLYKKIHEKHVIKCEKEYQLHGAFLIFSKDYIRKYDGLFDKTFMYVEEDILRYQCDRDGLVMKYLPDLKVYHKEGSSTNLCFAKKRDKRLFYYKNNILGWKLLIKLIENKI